MAISSRSSLVLVATLLLCNLVAAVAQDGVPAMIWSNGHCLHSSLQDQAAHVEQLVSSLFQPALEKPDVILAYISNKVKPALEAAAEDLAADVPALKDAFSSAVHSAAIPLLHFGHEAQSLAASLLAAFKQQPREQQAEAEEGVEAVSGVAVGGSTAVVGDCNVGGAVQPDAIFETVEELKEHLEEDLNSASPIKLVLICSGEASEGVDANLAGPTFEAAYSAVTSFTNKKHVVLYAGHDAAAVTSADTTSPGRRTLMDADVETVCGEDCLGKALVWEVLFVTIVLLTILISGFILMAAVETPSKFEVARET